MCILCYHSYRAPIACHVHFTRVVLITCFAGDEKSAHTDEVLVEKEDVISEPEEGDVPEDDETESESEVSTAFTDTESINLFEFRYYTNLPKTKKFDCVGRGDLSPDFSFVFKSCEIDRSQERLVK